MVITNINVPMVHMTVLVVSRGIAPLIHKLGIGLG